MTTFVLLPGAGSDGWHWHLVTPELEAAGHRTVAVDLPVEDDRAGLAAYVDVTVAAAGPADDVIVVSQSMGSLTAPLLCGPLPVRLLVLVCPMVPKPGESGGEWWEGTGQGEAMREAARAGGYGDRLDDDQVLYLHDVPADVVADSAGHDHGQSGTPFAEPWPLPAWPGVATRVVAGANDRLFPLAFQQRVTRARLGIEPDVVPSGHLPALACPHELARLLLRYEAEVPRAATPPLRPAG